MLSSRRASRNSCWRAWRRRTIRHKGSVTAALRATAESLNQQLLDHNLKEASSGQQGVGLLMLMSLREERIYLAQCGPTHAFLLSSGGMQHFYDPQPTRRGLGLGRTTPVYFSQISLKENDVLLLTPQPPAEWSETALSGLYGQGLETIRPRLMKLAGIDLSALLIQAKAGPGKVFLLRPKPATATPDTAAHPPGSAGRNRRSDRQCGAGCGSRGSDQRAS